MEEQLMQLRIWTPRPSALLKEVVCQGMSQEEANKLPEHSKFNGLFVSFSHRVETQFALLEQVAVRLGLQYKKSPLERIWYDNIIYPARSTAFDCGMHDAEIDMWYDRGATYPRSLDILDPRNPRRVTLHSPDEALFNHVLGIRSVLDSLYLIPEHQRNPEARETIAHNEGYLARVREEFSHLQPQVIVTEEK